MNKREFTLLLIATLCLCKLSGYMTMSTILSILLIVILLPYVLIALFILLLIMQVLKDV